LKIQFQYEASPEIVDHSLNTDKSNKSYKKLFKLECGFASDQLIFLGYRFISRKGDREDFLYMEGVLR